VRIVQQAPEATLHRTTGSSEVAKGGGCVPDRGAHGDATEVPFRQILDSDPDRGIAIYDENLRLVYVNGAARAHLHDRDGSISTAVTNAVQNFRDRLGRSETANPPAEILVGGDAERHCRATFAHLAKGPQHWFIVRLSPPGQFAEPSVRVLQTRFLLTLREAEVALAVSTGLTNAEVAATLGITEKTVKNALMAVFAKCRVRNRVELALQTHDVRFPAR
jgi:DNA-binding CsgD family transcriptional regulator